MNETFKHCVNSVFELYIYLLVSRRYPYHTLPPPYPWKIIVNCDEEEVLKTQIRKFQANLGFFWGEGGFKPKKTSYWRSMNIFGTTQIIIKYPTQTFNYLVRLH